jgi:hypothetical protein
MADHAALGVHRQGDLDLAADFPQAGQHPPLIFRELPKSIDVHGGVIEERGLLNRAQHVQEARVLVEAVLAEIPGVGVVDQVQVVDFVEQGDGVGSVVGRAQFAQQQVQIGGVLAAALELAERRVEFGGQSGLARGVAEKLEAGRRSRCPRIIWRPSGVTSGMPPPPRSRRISWPSASKESTRARRNPPRPLSQVRARSVENVACRGNSQKIGGPIGWARRASTIAVKQRWVLPDPARPITKLTDMARIPLAAWAD